MNFFKKFLFIVQFFVLIFNSVYADGITIQTFYAKLDNAIVKNNPEQIIQLLKRIEGSSVWSFGAGIGPIDSNSLQCVAVDSFLKISRDCYRKQYKYQANTNDEWRIAFSTEKTDSKSILRLLKHTKPAFRLIALRKLEGSSSLDEEIFNQLQTLVNTDPYVRIVRRHSKIMGNGARPIGFGETDIAFPLRIIARRILFQLGYSVKYDAEIEAMDGVRAFAKDWKDNPNRRKGIEEAISLLESMSYGVRAIHKLAEKACATSVYKVFERQLEK